MKRSSIILALAVLLAVFASFWLGGEFARRKIKSPLNRPDTVYVEKWVRDSIPPTPDSIKVETKVVYLPVHDTTFYAVHDTTNTIVHDSVLVEVPIVEKTYTGKNYRATIRGFQPELIDIWVKQNETYITIPYQKRWTVTIGPQAGFGFTPKGWQPYAGVGATFGYSF